MSIEMIRSRRWVWTALKAAITLLCLYYLFVQFQERNVSISDLEFPRLFLPILIVQLCLMVLNWFLEILRWKYAVGIVERTSFKQAAADVLGGLSLNWLLPFTLGDFVARIVAKRDKYKTTSAILLNRLLMFLLTLMAGVYGMIKLFAINISDYQMIGVIAFIPIVFLLVIRIAPMKSGTYLAELPRQILWKIVFLSIGRYSVFFLQFVILLQLFNPEITMDIIAAGIGWIFFVRTSVPSLLGGLGLRETSALVFFQTMVSDISTVVFPVFVLWILNTAIPSFLGALLLLKLKTHNSRDSHNIA